MRSAFLLGLLALSLPGLAQPPAPSVPKPVFQGDFFGEMPRVFCTLQKIDVPGRMLTVKLDSDGSIKQTPIGPDTEIHFRDSWGELTDYFPGQHVMLFMYVDEDHHWTVPRAVQDDIHMTARHNWFAKVLSIDKQARTYQTSRQEKDGQGNPTRTIEKEWSYLFLSQRKELR